MSQGVWEERIRKRGARGEGKPFPLPIVHRAVPIFQLLLFLLKYPAEASAEERIAMRLVHFIPLKFTIRRRRRGFPSGPGRAVEIAPSRELKE